MDQRTHEKSNLAVNTPAVTEDAVYVAFGNADIARYSHDGNVWLRQQGSSLKQGEVSVAGELDDLKLAKGVAFVKSQLRRLRQEYDVWEVDFRPIPSWAVGLARSSAK